MAKYLNYKSLNKAKKRRILDSESESSSSEEESSSSEEEDKNSKTYDSELGESEKSNDSDTEGEEWKNGCRELHIIDNLTNSKSDIKEAGRDHRLNRLSENRGLWRRTWA